MPRQVVQELIGFIVGLFIIAALFQYVTIMLSLVVVCTVLFMIGGIVQWMLDKALGGSSTPPRDSTQLQVRDPDYPAAFIEYQNDTQITALVRDQSGSQEHTQLFRVKRHQRVTAKAVHAQPRSELKLCAPQHYGCTDEE